MHAPQQQLNYSDQTETTEEVFEVTKKDMGYYLKSQGGVTLSGGEPLLQADFVSELLGRCKALGIHTAVETSGYVDASVFDQVLETLDLVLFDIKIMDRNEHKKYTGVYNDIILENAKMSCPKRYTHDNPHPHNTRCQRLHG